MTLGGEVAVERGRIGRIGGATAIPGPMVGIRRHGDAFTAAALPKRQDTALGVGGGVIDGVVPRSPELSAQRLYPLILTTNSSLDLDPGAYDRQSSAGPAVAAPGRGFTHLRLFVQLRLEAFTAHGR